MSVRLGTASVFETIGVTPDLHQNSRIVRNGRDRPLEVRDLTEID